MNNEVVENMVDSADLVTKVADIHPTTLGTATVFILGGVAAGLVIPWLIKKGVKGVKKLKDKIEGNKKVERVETKTKGSYYE